MNIYNVVESLQSNYLSPYTIHHTLFQMEELYEMTDRAGYEFYPARKRHLANRPSAETLSRILTVKRCFPQKPDPELLTWMERLMISHLG